VFRKTQVHITEENFMFGSPSATQIELLPKELELLRHENITTYQVYPHLHIAHSGRTITSRSSSRAKKRIDYCIIYSIPSSGILC